MYFEFNRFFRVGGYEYHHEFATLGVDRVSLDFSQFRSIGHFYEILLPIQYPVFD